MVADRKDGTTKRSVLMNRFLAKKVIEHCDDHEIEIDQFIANAVDKSAAADVPIDEAKFFGRWSYLKKPALVQVYFYAQKSSIELVAEVAELTECSKLNVVRAILAVELGCDDEKSSIKRRSR